MALKTDHFLTPIKLVLPGIIVSLVGATAGYFIFNNPEKQKAKQTFTSWNVIREYEAAYSRSANDAICMGESFDQLTFQKDLTHLLGVLIDNLEDLKKEENTDMRLKAFLNLKIARYADAKRLTEMFLDSVMKLNQANALLPNNPYVIQLAQDLQANYASEMEHIQGRDTTELKRIASSLNRDHIRYTDSFILELPRIQTVAEVRQNFMGKWRLPELDVLIEFKKDSTGTWREPHETVDFTWTITDRTITITKGVEIINFYIAEVISTKLTAVWQEKKFVVIGCRKD